MVHHALELGLSLVHTAVGTRFLKRDGSENDMKIELF